MREPVFDAAKVREKIRVVAAVCHGANREYAKTLGDHSIPSWEIAPMWMRESAIDGVEFHIGRLAAGEKATPAASHENWLKMKAADGWKFGPTKDAGLKTHPCFVPFAELPPEQQRKDWIFAAICEAFWLCEQPARAPFVALDSTFIANPVQVKAYPIVSVSELQADGSMHCALLNGENAIATPEMISRMTPTVGDYWVIQADGYAYLNPKEVFERKYRPALASTGDRTPEPVAAG